jgi:hypothetical protein
MTMKYTIDVSFYDIYTGRTLPNGAYQTIPIDWGKTGYPMAMIKSSQGISIKDAGFDLQWEAAKGLKRVAYHFFEPDPDAIKQAANLRRVVEPVFTENDFIAVDFENYRGNRPMTSRVLWLGSFLYETEKWIHDPKKIFIYTGRSYWYPCGGEKATWAAKYRLWQAIWPWENYFKYKVFPPYTWTPDQVREKKQLIESGMAKPPICLPWTETDIWQWTSRFDPLQVPGYYANKKQLDHNVIYMDLGEPTIPQYKTCPTCNGTGKVEA